MEYMIIDGQFPRLNNCAVTMGKFDGIHRGHRKLIEKILEHKRETGAAAVVLARKDGISWNTWEWTFFWNVHLTAGSGI